MVLWWNYEAHNFQIEWAKYGGLHRWPLYAHFDITIRNILRSTGKYGFRAICAHIKNILFYLESLKEWVFRNKGDLKEHQNVENSPKIFDNIITFIRSWYYHDHNIIHIIIYYFHRYLDINLKLIALIFISLKKIFIPPKLII